VIVVMKKGAAEREVDAVVARIEELGFRADPLKRGLSATVQDLLSDGPQSLTPAMRADLVVRVRAVARAVGRTA
jgi:hypothetical protein